MRGLYTRPLLGPAVRWLLAHALPPGAASTFSRWWFPGPGVKFARNAWCSGDPGVASALLLASEALDDAKLRAHAIAVGIVPPPGRWTIRPAGSTTPDCATVPPGSCTCSTGSTSAPGHGIRRGEPALAHPRARNAQRPGRRGAGRVAGFRAVITPRYDATPEFHDEPGLLTGAAGIGLALLAAVSDVEPGWIGYCCYRERRHYPTPAIAARRRRQNLVIITCCMDRRHHSAVVVSRRRSAGLSCLSCRSASYSS